MDTIKEGMASIILTVIASVFLIILGIIYFGFTLLIIKTASNVFFGLGLQANWAVLAAKILAFGAILARSNRKGWLTDFFKSSALPLF